MQCVHCLHETTKRHGKDRYGNQRFRCLACRKTFIQKTALPLGDMKIDRKRAVFALKLLLEGTSVRATQRLTGIHRDTLGRLVVGAGRRCFMLLRKTLRNLAVTEIECDELWGFIGMKEKTRQRLNRPENFGDCYTFLAIERNTKLIVAFHIGKRTSDDCYEFAARLKDATAGRFQVSTDGYGPYQAAIPLTFQFGVDFAQLIKRFGGSTDVETHRRYSPAQIISVDKTIGCGNPDMDRVCTSHSERLNLSLRMQIRRLTRLTNGHSKKLANHKAMLALYFAWYNFVRRHMTLKTTPAVAQGLTDHEWSLEELLTAAAKAS